MRYDYNCVIKANQKFLQPGDGIKIQVVGWLVKEQNVRGAEQRLGEQNLDLLRTVLILHQFIMKFCPDTEAV